MGKCPEMAQARILACGKSHTLNPFRESQFNAY